MYINTRTVCMHTRTHTQIVVKAAQEEERRHVRESSSTFHAPIFAFTVGLPASSSQVCRHYCTDRKERTSQNPF